MSNKYFNTKYGITTGNITLDAASGNIVSNGNANIAGLIVTQGLLVTGNLQSNLIPNANAVYNLGSSSNVFNNAYFNTANIASNIVLGSQTITSNTLGVIVSNLYTTNITTANIVADNANINAITVNNKITLNSSINATDTTTGSFTTQGGASVQKDLYVGGAIHLANNNGGTTSKVYLAYNDLAAGLDINFNN